MENNNNNKELDDFWKTVKLLEKHRELFEKHRELASFLQVKFQKSGDILEVLHF